MFTFSDFLLVCNFGVQVAAICVVHHNAQASFIHEWFLVGNDIRVSHRLQDMNLIDRVLSLFAIHLWNIDDLHNVGLTVSYRLNQDSVPEAAFSDHFKLSIPLHFK